MSPPTAAMNASGVTGPTGTPSNAASTTVTGPVGGFGAGAGRVGAVRVGAGRAGAGLAGAGPVAGVGPAVAVVGPVAGPAA